MSKSELLSCFDADGHVVEPQIRSKVHTEPFRYWHATTGIWVVNRRGEVLCSQRSSSCEGNPGKWQTMFGGHVKAGQTWRESAVAELEEEAGFRCAPEELLLISKGKSDVALHFSERFMYVADGTQAPRATDGEVSLFRWLPIDECVREQTVNADQWCNTLYPENAKIIQDQLAALSAS